MLTSQMWLVSSRRIGHIPSLSSRKKQPNKPATLSSRSGAMAQLAKCMRSAQVQTASTHLKSSVRQQRQEAAWNLMATQARQLLSSSFNQNPLSQKMILMEKDSNTSPDTHKSSSSLGMLMSLDLTLANGYILYVFTKNSHAE